MYVRNQHFCYLVHNEVNAILQGFFRRVGSFKTRVNRIHSQTDRDVRTNTSHREPFSDAGNEKLNNISHENLKKYCKLMINSQYINPASRPENGTVAAFNP